jgi:hypothetical protein
MWGYRNAAIPHTHHLSLFLPLRARYLGLERHFWSCSHLPHFLSISKTGIQYGSQVLRRRKPQDASAVRHYELVKLTMDIRNGSLESVKKIVSVLNDATLDPNVRTCSSQAAIMLFC